MTASAIRQPDRAGRILLPRLFRYVLTNFLVILVNCLVAFLMLFLLAAVYDDLEDFLKVRAPVSVIARYFMLLQPTHFVNGLPMSLLLATMYCVANLCRHNEITAVRANGISVAQLATPIWIVALICSALHFVTAEWWAPAAIQRAQALKTLTTDPQRIHGNTTSAYLAYHNSEELRDWLFEDFDQNGISTGIFITQFRLDGTEEWELRAEGGDYITDNWIFIKGVKQEFTRLGDQTLRPPERFEHLTCPDLTEDPRDISFIYNLKLNQSMAIPKILRILRSQSINVSPSTEAILKTYLFNRIFFPLSCLVAVLLGLPLAVTNERGTAMRSFLTAIGIMVMYMVMTEILIVLGKSQMLPPVVAGALPFLAFTCWGIWEIMEMG